MAFSLCPSSLSCEHTIPKIRIGAPLQTEVYHTIKDIPFHDWQALAAHQTSYLQGQYLEAMEECGEETEFRYILIRQEQQPLLIAYCQIVKFDMRKTTQYTEGATLPTLQEKITYFFSSQLKRLVANITVDLWVCGNLFLSGEYGFVQAPSLTESEARHLLLHAIEVACKREKRKIAGVLLKDCLLKEGVSFQDIEKHGFHPFKGDPIMMMQIPAHWHNFEDYLNDLSSKYRQRAKSAFKKSQSLQTRTLSLEDVAHLNDQIFPLFENVVAKSAFNLKTTPRKYFISLKKYLPQMVKMTGYFEEDRLVGFMTTIQTNDHLEAHFLGYNDTDNHAFKLYQRMLYDMIGEAIETKAPAISFGRTAMEIKTTVGAVPQPANMFLRLRYGVINLLAGTIIRNIKNEPFVPRHPFKGQEHLEVAAN